MFLLRFAILNFFIIKTISFQQIQAFQCNGFNCGEHSKCINNEEKNDHSCVCDEGYSAYIQNKSVIHCYQCFKAGDKCGPNYICNNDLICQGISDDNVELKDQSLLAQELIRELVCGSKVEKCLDKCCLENEVCSKDNTCLARGMPIEQAEVILNENCPVAQKCRDKCCASNELCSEENQCMLKENINMVNKSLDLLCEESHKCQDKCCAEHEKCANGKECIPEETQCPESQRCGGKCCTLTEICQDNNECIAKQIMTEICWEGQFCLDRCCAKNETCKENICVIRQASLKSAAECPEYQWCLDKCCASNEKCVNERECIAKEISDIQQTPFFNCKDKCSGKADICNSELNCSSQDTMQTNCHDSEKCQNICCGLKQICNEQNKCEDLAAVTPLIKDSCPQTQKCLEKCCSEEENCSEADECIPMHTIECGETAEMCGNKCCPVNETCNDANECVPFLVLSVSENCPPELKCLDSCCAPQEMCNEAHKCVNKNLAEISNLYDFSKEVIVNENANTLNTDYVLQSNDLDSIQEIIKCSSDHIPCHHKCCNAQEICIAEGECVAKINDTDCASQDNCLQYQNINNNNNTSAAYTMTGLGCLMAVLSFALFKVHAFRRSRRNVFYS